MTFTERCFAAKQPRIKLAPQAPPTSLPGLAHSARAPPLPGLAQPARAPPPTRRSYAQYLLSLPDEVLIEYTRLPGLQQALRPFASSDEFRDAYDAVAFVYSFGVDGPCAASWRALFTAAEVLRGEQIAICVGVTVIGGLEQKGKRALLEEVVMGSEEVPGVLERTCDGYDDWLVSVDALIVPIGIEAEAAAEVWWLEGVGEGRFVWMCERGSGSGVYEEHALGDAVAACAAKIGVEVTKRVVERAMKRVSWEGIGEALRRVRERAEILADGAKCKAESVLINRVFEVLGVQPPEDRGF